MKLSTAGSSSSIESNERGPITSSSGGSTAVDSSRNKPEDSKEPNQELNVQVILFLEQAKIAQAF